VADLWACFNGADYGEFHDIGKITMFADYRVPQILNTLGCLMYSPLLDQVIRQKRLIASGHKWEIQLRGESNLHGNQCLSPLTCDLGCSIWCVELIRREILKHHPDATINPILIDFFLYDTMKEREIAGKEEVPHHRTRSIWY
jgi:hypothetical protein